MENEMMRKIFIIICILLFFIQNVNAEYVINNGYFDSDISGWSVEGSGAQLEWSSFLGGSAHTYFSGAYPDDSHIRQTFVIRNNVFSFNTVTQNTSRARY
ncbi:MAG: hypothetical protein Q7T55_26485, partial [Solirubrobacteraceae bacterium]|nr:hypothetical protein [Solirubrobacteraceae bacterium]